MEIEVKVYQLIFWFDILTFTLMFASFGLGYIAYSRTKLPWLRGYLIYLICYAVWLLFSTYFFFQVIYLPHPLPGLSAAAAILRTGVSLIILYAGPGFALRVCEIPIGRREWWLLSLPVAFVLGTVIVYYATGSPKVVLVPNGLFNLYLGALFLLAALKSVNFNPGSLRHALRPFFWFSSVAYLVLLFANIFAVTVPAVAKLPYLNVGLAGLFCFIWSVLTIMIFLKRMGVNQGSSTSSGPPQEIPTDFIEAFGLTEREREITEDLVTGFQSREIADKRFISPRTVDTHVYNIYRKCQVKNRVELVRLIERYRG